MAENEQLGSVMESMFKGMDYMLGNKSVVGEAVRVDDNTFVMPLVNVSFGLGAGADIAAKEGKNRQLGGGGMGAKLTPTAVLIVQDGRARILNIQEEDKMVHMIESIPDAVKTVSSFFSKKSSKVDKAVEESFEKMDL